MSRSILLIEDDVNIAEGIAALLQAEGFSVALAGSIASAKYQELPWDLCLLDWMLPDGQGIHLLQHWRQSGVNLPVIMLTARAEVIDKVLGLEIGADDYVTKPFEPRELIARIHARLRDTPSTPAEELTVCGDLQINTRTMRVTYAGAKIDVTHREFELLLFLAKNAGQVYSRNELLDMVWGYDRYPSTRTVDTHVLQLRQKIRAELIETVRGVGYRFVRQT